MMLAACVYGYYFYYKLTLFLLIVATGRGCVQYEKCIYEEIFVNRSYNKYIRPVLNSNETVEVKMQLLLLGLQSINEIEGTMSTISIFRTTWVDKTLKWDPEQFGGVESIVAPAKKLWVPDIALSNSASSFYEEMYTKQFRVNISYDGTVYWPYGGPVVTNCDINLAKYPFDNQSCPIYMESWLYHNKEVELSFFENGGVDTSMMGRNTLWLLTETDTDSVLQYSNKYRRLVFLLKLKRKSLYYYVNIILPTLLLMVIALAVFWLPPDCGEKLSLAISVLLAFSVFQIIIMGITPVNSDVVPEITLFVLSVIFMATLSLLTSMVVSFIGEKDPSCRSPLWLRKLCFKYLAKILCMYEEKSDKTDYEKHTVIEDGINNTSPNNNNNNVECNGEIFHTGRFSNVRNSSRVNLEKMSELNRNKTTRNTNHIKKIVDDISKMRAIVEKKLEISKYHHEWKYIGRIIDRTAFWISALLLIVLILFIFLHN